MLSIYFTSECSNDSDSIAYSQSANQKTFLSKKNFQPASNNVNLRTALPSQNKEFEFLQSFNCITNDENNQKLINNVDDLYIRHERLLNYTSEGLHDNKLCFNNKLFSSNDDKSSNFQSTNERRNTNYKTSKLLTDGVDKKLNKPKRKQRSISSKK